MYYPTSHLLLLTSATFFLVWRIIVAWEKVMISIEPATPFPYRFILISSVAEKWAKEGAGRPPLNCKWGWTLSNFLVSQLWNLTLINSWLAVSMECMGRKTVTIGNRKPALIYDWVSARSLKRGGWERQKVSGDQFLCNDLSLYKQSLGRWSFALCHKLCSTFYRLHQ